MDSRQRFNLTLQHRRPDRCPIDYLAHPHTHERLKAAYDVGSESELLDALGADFYYLSGRDISQNESCMPYYKGKPLDTTETERTCPLGIRWTRGAGASKFWVNEAIGHPLESAETARDVLKHPWPTAKDFDFSPQEGECETNARRVVVGGLWTGIFGDSYRMMGFETFLMNLTMNFEVVKTLVDRMTEMYLELNESVFSLLKGKMDVWFFGNDFGSQSGLLMSQAMWEDLFFDNIRRLCALAHSYGFRVMMHSCGSIAVLIPRLIEAGVEILDPIQVTAKDMDPAVLKERYGERIVFHGAIDTQQVLPNESPRGVIRHVREMIGVLGRGGGYILAPSQILQPDIPLENIQAMYRAAQET